MGLQWQALIGSGMKGKKLYFLFQQEEFLFTNKMESKYNWKSLYEECEKTGKWR